MNFPPCNYIPKKNIISVYGDSDISGVKIELDRFALGGLEAGVQEMRQAMGGGAVDAAIGDFGEDAGAELVAERANLSCVVLG